ncbi:hypothetical protein LZ24_02238 [Desulfobotulus alkaliphilus]|uniref:Uncharacterized protein n=1 Tax=Desulfobotulus alkaliphilus TaxID=622671 RepID=A0A562RNN2_9BACT|nr:hypothetical protein [Desulfobotulus alkaliphilus]TWI70668.1 hypothetical protein LZ24_02238 [Desulfobotulus alkaliphilus]
MQDVMFSTPRCWQSFWVRDTALLFRLASPLGRFCRMGVVVVWSFGKNPPRLPESFGLVRDAEAVASILSLPQDARVLGFIPLAGPGEKTCFDERAFT